MSVPTPLSLSPRVSIVTAPTFEAVTLIEAKQHLKLPTTVNTEDAWLDDAISASIQRCEEFTWRFLSTRTVDYTIDSFPRADYISLPGAALSSITSLTYTDSDGTPTIWDSSNYYADTTHDPGRLQLAYNVQWPTVTLRPTGGIVIRYVAGPAEGSLPYTLKAGILIDIENAYNNRGDESIGQGITTVKLGRTVEALWIPWRLAC